MPKKRDETFTDFEDGGLLCEAIEEIEKKDDLDVARLLRLALLDIERLRGFETPGRGSSCPRRTLRRHVPPGCV